MTKNDDYIEVLRRKLQELAGIDEQDQSLRFARAIASLRGIASSIATVRPVDGFSPDGIAAALCILADDFERVEVSMEIATATRRAA